MRNPTVEVKVDIVEARIVWIDRGRPSEGMAEVIYEPTDDPDMFRQIVARDEDIEPSVRKGDIGYIDETSKKVTSSAAGLADAEQPSGDAK